MPAAVPRRIACAIDRDMASRVGSISKVSPVGCLGAVFIQLLQVKGVARRVPDVAVAILRAWFGDEVGDRLTAVTERVAAVARVVVVGLAREGLALLVVLEAPVAQHLQALRACGA